MLFDNDLFFLPECFHYQIKIYETWIKNFILLKNIHIFLFIYVCMSIEKKLIIFFNLLKKNETNKRAIIFINFFSFFFQMINLI